jgi:type II secretory pathway predicted ATPase ExeA
MECCFSNSGIMEANQQACDTDKQRTRIPGTLPDRGSHNIKGDYTKMYLAHYELIEQPFQTSPDPKFLWLGRKHKEALDCLMDGILKSQGFLLLTGDIGSGKTTLVNFLVETLNDEITVVSIPDPDLEALEFFGFIAHSLELEREFNSKPAFLLSFLEFLIQCHKSMEYVLIIIDEAQKISLDMLDELCLILDIDRSYTNVLNILLVSQGDFKTILLDTDNVTLREKITVEYNLEPLTVAETREYIAYRLKVAGNGREIFSPNSMLEIFAFSKGYPRLINTICDRALLEGYSNNLQTITPEVIKACARELTLPGEAERSKVGAVEPRRRMTVKWRWLVALSLAMLIVLSKFSVPSTYYHDGLANMRMYYGQLFEESKTLLSELALSWTQMVEHLGSVLVKILPAEQEAKHSDLRASTQPRHSSEVEVTEAAICKDVVRLAPVRSGTRFAASLGKLYCFTRVTGAKSPTRITHVWYLEGTEKSRVNLAVNSANWRTYSMKIIRSSQVGAWQVEVLDSAGTVLKTLEFEVKP